MDYFHRGMFSVPAGEPLLLVPLLSIPLLKLSVHTSWKLPGGRNQLQHHIYPIVNPASSSSSAKTSSPSAPVPGNLTGPVQLPLQPAKFVKSTGLVLSLDFNLSSGERTYCSLHLSKLDYCPHPFSSQMSLRWDHHPAPRGAVVQPEVGRRGEVLSGPVREWPLPITLHRQRRRFLSTLPRDGRNFVLPPHPAYTSVKCRCERSC